MTSPLPDEVWEYIFDQLDNPTDYLNVINSSQNWRRLLSGNRTLSSLLQLVLPVLLNTGSLTPTEILVCRQVCKKWKGSVEIVCSKRSYFKVSFYDVPKIERCASFLQSISTPVWFPTVVEISFLDFPWVTIGRFYQAAFIVVEKVGKTVKRLEFGGMTVNRHVPSLLYHTTNLTALHFFNNYSEYHNNSVQFPPLAHLKQVHYSECGVSWGTISAAFDAYGKQLDALKCCANFDENDTSVCKMVALGGHNCDMSTWNPSRLNLHTHVANEYNGSRIFVPVPNSWNITHLQLLVQNSQIIPALATANKFALTLKYFNLLSSGTSVELIGFDLSKLGFLAEFPELITFKTNLAVRSVEAEEFCLTKFPKLETLVKVDCFINHREPCRPLVSLGRNEAKISLAKLKEKHSNIRLVKVEKCQRKSHTVQAQTPYDTLTAAILGMYD